MCDTSQKCKASIFILFYFILFYFFLLIDLRGNFEILLVGCVCRAAGAGGGGVNEMKIKR